MSLPKVDHRMLKHFIDLAFKTSENLLITGKPGIGKTVATVDYCTEHGYDIMISHPVVDEPADYKGLASKGQREVKTEIDEYAELMDLPTDTVTRDIAKFLPFGNLLRAMEATQPLVWFFDDFGQAPMSVQCALMQIFGQREINGKRISDHVRLIAATNRREDSAGVKGLLEPVKSRFGMIVELITTKDQSIGHFYKIGVAQPIIDYINYTPQAVEDFKPNKTMENSPNPRLWVKLSKLLKENTVQDRDFIRALCCSCVGEAYGSQLAAFMAIYERLPTYLQIVADCDDRDLNDPLDIKMAILGMLANQGRIEHSHEIFTYIRRLAMSYQVVFIRSLVALKSEVLKSKEAQVWTAENMDVYLD